MRRYEFSGYGGLVLKGMDLSGLRGYEFSGFVLVLLLGFEFSGVLKMDLLVGGGGGGFGIWV